MCRDKYKLSYSLKIFLDLSRFLGEKRLKISVWKKKTTNKQKQNKTVESYLT